MATFNVQPPDKFDFNKPEEWPKWSRRFERFRTVSGLSSQDENEQIDTLIYCMGDEAEDVITALKISATDIKKYDSVKARLDLYFVPKRNVIFEGQSLIYAIKMILKVWIAL